MLHTMIGIILLWNNPTWDNHMPGLQSGTSKEKRSILVVEDNESNRSLFIHMLEHLGWKVSSVRNGKDALDVLSVSVFDAVLMDIQMPEVDGFDVILSIRNQKGFELNRSIPILAATAYSSKECESRCYAVGANHILAKPVKLSDLSRALEGIVGS